MKEAARIITEILNELKLMAKPGTNLLDIEKAAGKLIKKYKVRSFNQGYEPTWAPTPYPNIMCLTVNEEITHGIPRNYELQEGDLVGIDLSIVTEAGFCADAGLTVPVGKVENRKSRLLYYTYKILIEAISMLHPGADTEEIANFIKLESLKYGYQVNRRFAGHRIEKEMHLKPNIYNAPDPTYKYAKLKIGEVYCVEPFLTPGTDNIGMSRNGWTFYTSDGQPSAFYEHMVLITENGPEILTGHIEPPER